jgi:hypothetical protein
MNLKRLEKLMTSLLMVSIMDIIGKDDKKKDELSDMMDKYSNEREDKANFPKGIFKNKEVEVENTKTLIENKIKEDSLKEKAIQADREASDKRAMLELNKNGR